MAYVYLSNSTGIIPIYGPDYITVNEGNVGESKFFVRFNLSAALPNPVSVSYSTLGLATQPSYDYIPQVAAVTIPAGSLFVDVPFYILGDTIDETDEVVTIAINKVDGADYDANKKSIMAFIQDDDPPGSNVNTAPPSSLNPKFSIRAVDADKPEGNSGSTPFTFEIFREGDLTSTTSVMWYRKIVDGNGQSNTLDISQNYVGQYVTFQPGESAKTISVMVNGDRIPEADEEFTIEFRTFDEFVNATGVTKATGIIRNDDNGKVVSIVRSGIRVDSYFDSYQGPVSGIKWQFLGNEDSEVVNGTDDADFLNLMGNTDAASGGAGDDVLDGGTGSNFLTGGNGADTFFVDGRNTGITWSTVTDFDANEWATAWGWREGISKLTWVDMAGADAYKGATAHMDFDGNGTIDSSMTFTGKAVGSVISMTGQVGNDAYLAFRIG
ncbi:Calx-beta domain-containing protein [Azospirillum canadense]|uniref:Calx-beta domain-containing protein n=1 Tax=Azospirillum canadense TaxID=403962 RepID=UPI002226F43A|nr:Calx-beta domain-containing protein [Azospirillum canadense]MCW2242299.1 hypothetical protein [Azospirillum canadense]